MAVALLGLVGDAFGLALLFFGFAPSCLLVFALPEAPVSQPIAVIGGHLIAATVGVLGVLSLPFSWWGAASVAGIATGVMALARVIHPPAAATAVIAFTTGAGWSFILLPVLVAAALIVVVGVIWHRVRKVPYPMPPAPLGGGPRKPPRASR